MSEKEIFENWGWTELLGFDTIVYKALSLSLLTCGSMIWHALRARVKAVKKAAEKDPAKLMRLALVLH